MKFSLFDKVLAISLVLAVSGISLKALSTESKPAMNLQDQVKKKVTKRVKNLKKVDYNQIREDYEWDLDGASDMEDSFQSWD
ncbi:MAG: hypothetical protein IKH08_09915 [Prevotella sp.]|jgi:hypothetical protein|nr:hypothetical protein [Prevotella sp.]MBR4602367.1 hypothetical protein [Prevotella sp.]MDO4980083.1 hypothetical protein [Prevotellaceae bacterium]